MNNPIEMEEYKTTTQTTRIASGDTLSTHENGKQDSNQELAPLDIADDATGELENNALSKEPEYITGAKLFMLLGSLTLVLFLMMMDISIVSTVSDLISGLEFVTFTDR